MVRFGFLAGYAAIAVGVQLFEHALAEGGEFLSRQLAVMIGVGVAQMFTVPVAPLVARFAHFIVARMRGRLFFCRNDAVAIGVEAREHFQRAGEEFIARNRPVMVSVRRRHVLAVVAATMFPALELAIVIGVDAREHGAARLVEFCARYRTVMVGIGSEQMFASPAVFMGESRPRRQRRHGRRNQNRPHCIAPNNVARFRALPAALSAA